MGIYYPAKFECKSAEEVARFGYAFLWVCGIRKEICCKSSVQMYQEGTSEQDIQRIYDNRGDLNQLCDISYDSIKGISDSEFVNDYMNRQAGYHGKVFFVKEDDSVIIISCNVVPQDKTCICTLSNMSEKPLEKEDIEFSKLFATLMKSTVERLQTLADAGITPEGDK